MCIRDSITYEYILDQLHDDLYTMEGESGGEPEKAFDQTVEYDALLSGFITENTDYALSLIHILSIRQIRWIYTVRPDLSESALRNTDMKLRN